MRPPFRNSVSQSCAGVFIVTARPLLGIVRPPAHKVQGSAVVENVRRPEFRLESPVTRMSARCIFRLRVHERTVLKFSYHVISRCRQRLVRRAATLVFIGVVDQAEAAWPPRRSGVIYVVLE